VAAGIDIAGASFKLVLAPARGRTPGIEPVATGAAAPGDEFKPGNDLRLRPAGRDSAGNAEKMTFNHMLFA
jgi:hypothetical protein